MHSELVALRAQIDRLERTLAVTIFVALVAAIVGTPIAMRAAGGPTKVTAPFTVVDASGRALLQVDARPGGGRLVIYNTAQDRVAEVDASDNGQAGHVRVYLAGEAKPKVSMGVYDDDTGGLDLAGLEGALAQLTGKGIVLANADRHPVASFRQTMDSGWMKLWSDDHPTSELWKDSAGGRLTIFGSNGGEDYGGNSEAATASEAVTIEGQTGGLAKMTFLANGK